MTVSGNNANAVFSVLSGGLTVHISGLTVTQGSSSSGGGINNTIGNTLTLSGMVISQNASTSGSAGGGGIFNAGTLTVNDSTIHQNTSTFDAGGIYNSAAGSLTVVRSTISANTTTVGDAGGIMNKASGAITVRDSLIRGNSARNQGGGMNGLANITNSTISTNQVTDTGGPGHGGGIYGGGTWTNVTIANNTAGSSGGGVTQIGLVTMTNTIVSGNTAPVHPDFAGTFTSGGHNLVQTRGTSTGYIASDLPDGTDPLLGPLQNNGGPTNTHVPALGSPALDAGDDAAITNPPFAGPPFFDQRRLARIVDGPDGDTTATVDIGAVEANYMITASAGTPQSTSITAFATDSRRPSGIRHPD